MTKRPKSLDEQDTSKFLTGLPEEKGIEEGDWTDYTNPLKGIGSKVGKMAAREGGGLINKAVSFLKGKAPAAKTRKPYPGEDLKTAELKQLAKPADKPKPKLKVKSNPKEGPALDYSAMPKKEGPGESKTKLVYDKFGIAKEVPNK